MAKRPPDDPRIADLARYRKARERAKRAPPPKSPNRSPNNQSFLGSRPRAGLILIAVIVLLALLTLGPRFF
ncbi:MAG: hypothetical protein JWO33_2461 [Caulobacteraceae bacterium]|nr:hypothetical protein [Caulobacteraceae bacterium]